MAEFYVNWMTQIKKGYLELCILSVIDQNDRVYGFDLIEKLKDLGLEVKEGTLYPLFSRMTSGGLLQAEWETENLKGHPRKFYSLTRTGKPLLKDMRMEFKRMSKIFTSTGE